MTSVVLKEMNGKFSWVAVQLMNDTIRVGPDLNIDHALSFSDSDLRNGAKHYIESKSAKMSGDGKLFAYSTNLLNKRDVTRVVEVDQVTLEMKFKNFPNYDLENGSSNLNYFNYYLGHFDFVKGRFGEWFLIGSNNSQAHPKSVQSFGRELDRIMAVNLATGKVISPYSFPNGPHPLHFSGNATGWPGWVVVNFSENGNDPNHPFYGSVAVIDLYTGAVRNIVKHNSTERFGDAEAKANISHDGRSIVFSSDWQRANPYVDVFMVQPACSK